MIKTAIFINMVTMTKMAIMLCWSSAPCWSAPSWQSWSNYDQNDDHWRLNVEAVQAIEASVADEPRVGMHSKVHDHHYHRHHYFHHHQHCCHLGDSVTVWRCDYHPHHRHQIIFTWLSIPFKALTLNDWSNDKNNDHGENKSVWLFIIPSCF